MKNIFILTLTIILFSGCMVKGDSNEYVFASNNLSNENMVIFEGCEYFVISNYPPFKTFTHKGNCKNPIHYY